MACTLAFTISGVPYELEVDENMTEQLQGKKTLEDVLDLLNDTDKTQLLNHVLQYTNMQTYDYTTKPTVAELRDSTDIPNLKYDRLITTLQDMTLVGKDDLLRKTILELLTESPISISLVSKKITNGSAEGHGVYIPENDSIYLHVPSIEGFSNLEDVFASKNGNVYLERLAHELVHSKLDSELLKANKTTIDGIVSNFKNQSKTLKRDYPEIVDAILKTPSQLGKAKEIVAYSFSNFKLLTDLSDPSLNKVYEKAFKNFEGFKEIAGLSSSVNSTETVNEPQEDVSFIGNADIALTKQIAVVNPGTKEYQQERAIQVLDRFNNNTTELQKNAEFKYKKFDVSYGEPTNIDEFNSEIQILRLTENDLVKVSKDVKWDKNLGQWIATEGEGKSSYRPIIKTYIDSNNELMVTLPMKDGSGKTYNMPARFIENFRKYHGDLLDIEVNQNKVEEYAQWMRDNVNTDGKKDASKLVVRTFELPGSGFKISVPSNYESYGFSFSNPDQAKDLYNGLVVGDVVKVRIAAKGDKSAGGFRAKVIRKFGNALEVITHTGATVIVKPSDLREIIYLKENHEDFLDMVKKNDTEVGKRILSQELLDDSASKLRKFRKINFVSQVKEGLVWNEKLNPYYDIYSDTLTEEDYKKNQSRRRNEVSKLNPGDLVKIKWESFNKSSWYPVVAKTSDKIYFYNTASGKVLSVNIMGSDTATVYGLAFNNTENSKLFDEFSQLREKFEGLWDGDVKANLSDTLKNAEASSVADAYYITEIENTVNIKRKEGLDVTDNDINDVKADSDLKLALSQVERGSIIKAHVFNLTKDGQEMPTRIYKWFVVTDFDEETGRPIGITTTKDKGKQTGMYKEYPIEFADINAIGQRLTDNTDLNIYGNKVLVEYLTRLRDTYKTINEPIFIEDSITAKAPYQKFGKTFGNAMYGLRKDGKMGYAVSEKYIIETFKDKKDFLAKQKKNPELKGLIWDNTGPKLFILRGKQYLKKIHTNYLEVHGLQKYKPDIHNTLQIGDIVTETYINKTNEQKFIDGMVTKISPTGLWIEQATKTPSDTGVNIRTKKIYRRTDGVEYPSISDIYIHKKNDVTSTNTLTAKERQSILLEGNPDFTPAAKTSLKQDITKTVKKSVQTDGFFKTRDSDSKIMEVVNKLKSMYDVDMIPMRTQEIIEKFGEVLGNDAARSRGFIYNGKVYINLDIASSAEPLHEMGHLILESIKKSNYGLYQAITSAVESHPYYEEIAKSYPNRTPEDLNEEVFVSVFAEKYRNIEQSKYNKGWYDENESLFSNILSYIKSMFASSLQNNSILKLSNEKIISMSLDELISKFGDNMMEGKFSNALNSKVNTVERKLVNLKGILLENTNDSEIYLRKTCSI